MHVTMIKDACNYGFGNRIFELLASHNCIHSIQAVSVLFGYELSWVRVDLGKSWYWVRLVLGTSW